MSVTTIEWTDAVWNPVTGCTKVSPGCKHCYAETIADRFWAKQYPGRKGFTEVRFHPERLDQPLKWRKPRRVFVNSMSDLFHESISVEFILATWAVMEASPQHTYQILTKRPERMRSILSVAPVTRTPNGGTASYERREIPGWLGYCADTDGAIWSGRRGRLHRLSPCVTSKWGHAHVTLHAGPGAAALQVKVHRLVLTAFDRQPRDGEEACHINGDASDNRPSNLRWGSRADNSADRTAHGNAVTAPTLTIKQVAEVRIAALRGETQRDIGARFGISHTQVGRIISGESWGLKVLPNVWLGVSVENQETADERIPLLLQVPAAVRFLSCEPLLGSVDLRAWMPSNYGCSSTFVPADRIERNDIDGLPVDGLDWVIVGGESGNGARPCDLAWIRSIVEQCRAAGVRVFVKQDSGPKPGHQGRIPDELWLKEFPVKASET